jgi:two-component system, sensor histidine kinase and response regulator
MIDIDIRTILFYLSLGNFFVLIFLLFIGIGKSRDRTNQFILAKLFQAIAWFLLATREVIPNLFSFYVSNLLLLIGFGAEMLSLITYKVKLSFTAKRNYYIAVILLFIPFAISRIWFPYYGIATASLTTGLVFTYGGLKLINRNDNSNYSYIIGWANLIFSLILFFRMFTSFVDSYNLFSRNIVEQVTFISVFMIMLLNTMGYLLLLKQLDEDEILANNEKLEKLNNEKNKFFSIIAHDLRGPIGNLSTLGDVLKDQINELTNDDKESLISSIDSSAKETYKLLNNLLEWSQAEIDGIKVRTTRIDLRGLVASNISLLQEMANTKNINLSNGIESNHDVQADPNMLDTIIRNLLSNALKYTQDNGLVTIKSKELENGIIQVSVQDNGVGMSQDVIHKLFKIDMHHSTKGTRNEPGTGLGLNLCKEFVERNEGEIWVESVENEGSTFYFTLNKA